MPAGTATSARTGTAVAATRSPGHTTRLVARTKDRLFPLDLFAAALFTFQRGVLLAHGADDFEFLLARFADIFINGHGIHLVSNSFEIFCSHNIIVIPLGGRLCYTVLKVKFDS